MVETGSSKPYPHQSPLADKFSGDWRDYVQISDDYNRYERAFLEKEFDKHVQSVPEFCDHLRRSQNLYATHHLNGTPKENQKVLVRPPNPSSDNGRDFANSIEREVALDLQNYGKTKYKTDGDKRVSFSFPRTKFHEFEHIGDPEIIRMNHLRTDIKEHIYAEEKKKLEANPRNLTPADIEDRADKYAEHAAKKMRHGVFEEYTVQRNDAVMARHFDEPARKEYRNGRDTNGKALQGVVSKETSDLVEDLRKDWVDVRRHFGAQPKVKTYEKTAHADSFVPLNIVSINDPERERLAHTLNSHIEKQISLREHGCPEYEEEVRQYKTSIEDGTVEGPPPIPLEARHSKIQGLHDDFPSGLKEGTSKEIAELRELYLQATNVEVSSKTTIDTAPQKGSAPPKTR